MSIPEATLHRKWSLVPCEQVRSPGKRRSNLRLLHKAAVKALGLLDINSGHLGDQLGYRLSHWDQCFLLCDGAKTGVKVSETFTSGVKFKVVPKDSIIYTLLQCFGRLRWGESPRSGV